MTVQHPWRLHHTLLLGVVLVGLVIRFHGLVWTLPLYFWGDETRLVLNGVTLQQTGRQNYQEAMTIMTNYPPLRSWEVALTRSILVTLGGQEAAPNGTLVMYGRMFSLFYALLTITFLYKLGRSLTHNAYVGIITALFFATWSHTILFGQRTLADGVGLMFFMLAAWLAVRAYQQQSYRTLVGSVVAGLLAGLGKYNYLPVLLLPGLALLAFLIQGHAQLLLKGLAVSAVLAIPIMYLAARTVSTDDLYYQFLDEQAQIEGTLRNLQLRSITPDTAEWQAAYKRYPLTAALRLQQNYTELETFAPRFSLGLIGVGLMSLPLFRSPALDYPALGAVGFAACVMFIAFSSFRVVEGRQLFGAMLLLVIFAAIGIWNTATLSKPAAVLVLGVLIVPMAYEAWTQNNELTKPDTRVATVQWLLENARDGTGVVLENEPYEFWEANGYNYPKHFNVTRAYRLFDQEPPAWENQGFYYLIADRSYEWRGGYYAGHEKQAFWDQYVEVVARFEGDAYAGPDRIIMRAFRPQFKTDTLFGNVVNFYGYTLNATTFEPGETLHIKYFWWAKQPTSHDYIIFNHLINTATGISIQGVDRLAGHNGTKPSSQWEENEWLFDEFDIPIPLDTAPGDYRLEMGLYSSTDGARLTIPGSPDGIFQVATVTVESEAP